MKPLTIPYWNAEVDQDAIALWWNGEQYQNYAQFCDRASDWQSQLASDAKSAVLFYIGNTPDAVAALTGILASGHAVLLADPKLPELSRNRLEASYLPQWIVEDEAGALTAKAIKNPHHSIHPDLALLLSTSGSTGSPKYVRLSHENVVSNATAIAEVLDIKSDDLAAAHLDFHYSYGLSVLSSHLVSGAGLSLTSGKFTDKVFWQAMKTAPVTHLPGVPVNYQIMHRLQMKRLGLPHIKTMTQAGGRLAKNIRDDMHAYMDARGGKFYVMYGQTEAAPRMSTLPHSAYATKSNAVGPALPKGKFIIVDDAGHQTPVGTDGQVRYQGPNVMMGYAMDWHDLDQGDVQGNSLDTGDIGNLDTQGYLTITGRQSRVGKVYGWRVNLDEVEKLLVESAECAVVQSDEVIAVVFTKASARVRNNPVEFFENILEQNFQLPITAYRFYQIPELPLTARDKTDYVHLAQQIQLLPEMT